VSLGTARSRRTLGQVVRDLRDNIPLAPKKSIPAQFAPIEQYVREAQRSVSVRNADISSVVRTFDQRGVIEVIDSRGKDFNVRIVFDPADADRVYGNWVR
jgi:hypothetical protein